MLDLVHILRTCIQQAASDVMLVPNEPPIVRIHGSLEKLAMPALSPQDARNLILSILTSDQKTRLEENHSLDFSFSSPGISRFRVNVFRQSHGLAAMLRVISGRIPSPQELGLTQAVVDMTNLPRGLVLVTGPAGSGKSTTLASLIEVINHNHHRHVLTIEDPIEFVYQNKHSIINQREVGNHAKSFAYALRDALRQNPDVILIGEMRDLETISLAITAAETGHLCFATLHTQDAPSTVDRIINAFPADQQNEIRTQLSLVLAGVVSQTLLPRKGGGLACAREIMTMTTASRSLLREAKTHQLYGEIEAGGKLGMVSMDQALASLFKQGTVELQEAVAKAHNQANLRNLIALAAESPSGKEQGPAASGSLNDIFAKKLW